MDLIDCIQAIKTEQAKLPISDLTEEDRQERRRAIETMCCTIENTLPNVRIKSRWDGSSVSILGVRASCTAGLNGAFSNWIAAARRRLDQTGFVQSTGEKENVR